MTIRHDAAQALLTGFYLSGRPELSSGQKAVILESLRDDIVPNTLKRTNPLLATTLQEILDDRIAELTASAVRPRPTSTEPRSSVGMDEASGRDGAEETKADAEPPSRTVTQRGQKRRS